MSDKQPRAEQLAMQVLGLLPLCYKRVVHQRNRDGGLLTPMQQQALMVLAMSPHPLSMTQLARALDVSRQQLTKLVGSLEEKKLAVREHDRQNRRLVLIRLSEKGREKLDQALTRMVERTAPVFDIYSAAERTQICASIDVLQRLLERIRHTDW